MTDGDAVSFAPVRSPGPCGSDEPPVAAAARIASHFNLPAPVEAYDFPDKGNINQHTFLITGGTDVGNYLLQQINQQVFTRPAAVMAAMISCVETQHAALGRYALSPGQEWETITLIPTRKGTPYLEFHNRKGKTYWRLMRRIPDCRTYKSLSELTDRQAQLAIAAEAGRGLAIYCDLTADMDTSDLENPLPGYRDTALYYRQLHSVLQASRTLEEAAPFLPLDEKVLGSTAQHFLVHLSPEEYRKRIKNPEVQRFVQLAQQNQQFGMTLLEAMKSGAIRRVAIHGDTKLDNFLISTESGRVKALIDLDTIMPHTWLVDWGDMVRSLVNIAGEKERDLSKVAVDLEIYQAIARGFLSTASRVTSAEIGLMVDAVQIIALELGIRFLTDYLRGDSYFKLSSTDPPDLNRVRGMVQLTLFEQLRARDRECRDCIRDLLNSSEKSCDN